VSAATDHELIALAKDYGALAAHYREQGKQAEADSLELSALVLAQAVDLLAKSKRGGKQCNW
jgi:hypothetical protein